MTPTYLLFSIAPLAVAPPLTFPLLPPLSLSPFLGGASEPGFRLPTDSSVYPSLSGLSHNERTPSFNFQKARWDDFAFYYDSHYLSAKEYSCLSLSSAAALCTSLALNAAKSSIPFSRIKRHPKDWLSAEGEDAASENARLLLSLTEVMKIARLTSLLVDVFRLSMPRLRLRHGRQLALLSRSNLTLNLYTLFFALSLPLLPPLLTSLIVLLPGSRLRSTPLT